MKKFKDLVHELDEVKKFKLPSGEQEVDSYMQKGAKGKKVPIVISKKSNKFKVYVDGQELATYRNEKEAIQQIIELTNDSSGLVRTCAYGALGHLEVKESAKQLHRGIFDSNLEAVKSAAYALARINEKITQKEIDELKKLDESDYEKILKFFN